MLVYIFLLLSILLVYGIAYSQEIPDPKRRFLTAAAILIILVLGSRHSQYGFSDEGMYYKLYERYIGVPFGSVATDIASNRDNGFFLMTWVLAQIIKWPQFFIYFETATFIIPAFWFIYKNANKPLLAVMAIFGSGLLSFCLSAFRQSIAISLCLIAYEILDYMPDASKKKRRIIWGILVFLIAYSMHRSAVVFLLAMLICRIKSVRLKLFATVSGSLIMLIFRKQLYQIGSEMLEKNYIVEYHMSAVGLIIQLILLITPVFLLLMTRFFREAGFRQHIGDYSLQKASNASVIALVACVLFALRIYAHSFERLAYYFFPFAIIAYPISVEYAVSEKSRKTMNMIFSVLCMALFLWRVRNGVRGGEFAFFWQRV